MKLEPTNANKRLKNETATADMLMQLKKKP